LLRPNGSQKPTGGSTPNSFSNALKPTDRTDDEAAFADCRALVALADKPAKANAAVVADKIDIMEMDGSFKTTFSVPDAARTSGAAASTCEDCAFRAG